MIMRVALSRPYLHSTIDYVYEPPDAERYLAPWWDPWSLRTLVPDTNPIKHFLAMT